MSSAKTARKPVWVNNLKEYRIKKGFSQTDLADQVGLSQQTILQIVKGILSGRKHMDVLSSMLKAPGLSVFPYYEFVTYTEAAQMLGVSPTLISKRVDEGIVKAESFGNVHMIHRSNVSESILRRQRVSIRKQMKILLSESPSGLSVDSIVEALGPFDGDELLKKKRSIQSILSRGDEFYVDKDGKPPIWFTRGS